MDDMERSDVLRIAQSHPVITVADGQSVIAAGDRAAALFVLAQGSLEIRAGDRLITIIGEPGSIVGEIGLLLDTPASADVIAKGETTVHRIEGAADLFVEHPGFGQHLAVVLARRLRQVTTFLGDIEEQFADRRDTLGLVPAVLSDSSAGRPETSTPGPSGSSTAPTDGSERDRSSVERTPPLDRAVAGVEDEVGRHRADVVAGVEDECVADAVVPRTLGTER